MLVVIGMGDEILPDNKLLDFAAISSMGDMYNKSGLSGVAFAQKDNMPARPWMCITSYRMGMREKLGSVRSGFNMPCQR